MKKILKIIFLFSTTAFIFPLYAADIPYCPGTDKPFAAKNQALQSVIKQVSSEDCVIAQQVNPCGAKLNNRN